jgi:hypothetical protein
MRTRFSDFTTSEQNGTTFVTAVPQSSADEPVRFDASIADRGSDDDPQANWEEIISTLAQGHLGNELLIEGGRGVIDKQVAIDALVESDAEHVRNEHAAHAVLEYLADQEIISIDGEEVVVLMSYEKIREEGTSSMLNNWAATLDACVERIDSAIDRVKQNQETLQQHFEDLSDTQNLEQEYAQKADELKQEMKGLLAGRMPSELPDDEKRRFEMLRKRYHRYEMFEEKAASPVAETQGPEILGAVVEDMENIKLLLIDQSQEFRKLALSENFTESGALQDLENLESFVAEFGDVTEPSEQMEEKSDDEFVEDLFDMRESTTSEEVQQLDEDATLETTR